MRRHSTTRAGSRLRWQFTTRDEKNANDLNQYAQMGAGRLTNQTVNGAARVCAYSFRSQMTGLTDTNAASFAYEFDGEGNRVSSVGTAGPAVRFVYDGPNVVLDLDAATLEPVSAYVHGPGIDQPIEWLRLESGFPEAPSRAVYHTDGLGSVVAMTRGSGSGALVLRTYSYEAFGKVRVETQAPFAPANRYTYTARESLGDSAGFMYYRWRVMDPNTGRFTSEDPLGFVDGPNSYLYARNNPTLFVDPLGYLSSCKAECARELHRCMKKAMKHNVFCLAACAPICAVGGCSACVLACATVLAVELDDCADDAQACLAKCKEDDPCKNGKQ